MFSFPAKLALVYLSSVFTLPTLRPVLIAAYNGCWSVLEVLLNHRIQAVDGVPTVQLDVQVVGTVIFIIVEI
jgi:hypothetical protein